MQVHGGELPMPLLQIAIGINCNMCRISCFLKRAKKKPAAEGSLKSAAFSFISYHLVSCVVMWFYLCRCRLVSMVSLFACSIHRRRNACLFGFFCLFIFYFLIEITSYLLSDAARARVFVSLTSFITLQTAFKERCRCL